MINAGADFAAAVTQYSRRFHMRLFDGSAEVDGTIRNAKVHLGSTGPESFFIGAVYSSYAEIVLDGRNTTLEGKELRLDAGILTDAGTNTYVDITIGFFTALTPAATKYRTTFTAVGRITSKLAVTEFTAPATPTLANIAAAITQLTGVAITFASGINTSNLIDYPVTGTCRDALTAIAVAVGGYATETNTGSILVNRYSSSVSTASYGPDTMQVLPEIADYDFEITGVQAITPTGLYEEGDPINVSIDSNYVTEELFEDFAEELIGFSFRPGTAALALGDPRIEPQDVLEISTPDEESYIMPCLAITHIFDGGVQTEITTPAVQAVGEVVGTMSAEVREASQLARQAASDASEAAAGVSDARKVATNYLSRDNTGIMVADLSGGAAYTPSTVPAGVKNTHIDSDSFDVRDGQTVLASFGETSQVGPDSGAHMNFDFHSIQLVDKDGDTVFEVIDLRDAQGYATITETLYGDGSKKDFEVQYPISSVTSVKVDNITTSAYTVSDTYSLRFTTAPAYLAKIVVTYKTTSQLAIAFTYGSRQVGVVGPVSFASGIDVLASGAGSHAEGEKTHATGNYSHAEGGGTTAQGEASHAEGYKNTALGAWAHVEGTDTFAWDDASHAQNRGTVTGMDSQTAMGRYNYYDESRYALIVGNGTKSQRSNALGVTWDGNIGLGLSATGTDTNLYNIIQELGIANKVIYSDATSLPVIISDEPEESDSEQASG